MVYKNLDLLSQNLAIMRVKKQLGVIHMRGLFGTSKGSRDEDIEMDDAASAQVSRRLEKQIQAIQERCDQLTQENSDASLDPVLKREVVNCSLENFQSQLAELRGKLKEEWEGERLKV
jgi:hypothetical protein